jgi:gliding motility-associated-like protein
LTHFPSTEARRYFKGGTGLLLFIILFFTSPAGGQQYNNWIFGSGAGISFNAVAGQPVPHNIYGSVINAFEGSASVSDQNGKLLFYTNGEKVWNKNHTVMPQGEGLLGHGSAYQSSLIVPRPGSTTVYYIFTADAIENNLVNGYNYSVVDMAKDNGLGEVVTKNVRLQAPGTERLTAARHTNGIDIWIITNDFRSNTFRAWLLTCEGVNPTPVVSNIGEVLDEQDRMNIGAMKVSPDGKLLCQTHFSSEVGTDAEQFFQLFDFNNATGVLSNVRSVHLQGTGYASCEFSSNSSLLYLTEPLAEELEQFEAKLATATAVAASRVIIPCNYGMYAMQLAPDKKIYLTNSTMFLSIIEQPDVKGLGCSFQQNSFNLDGRNGWIGLPSVLHDLEQTGTGFTYAIVDTCMGTVQFNAYTDMGGAVEWSWDFGDGNVSNLQNPQHRFIPANGIYQVKLKITPVGSCGFISKSAYVRPGFITAAADFEYAADCPTSTVSFLNQSAYSPDSLVSILWEFGDGNTSTEENPVHSYSAPGVYNVKLRLITPKACLDGLHEVTIDLRLPGLTVSPDRTITERESVQLQATGNATSFEWTPATALNNSRISNPVARPFESITYTVTAKNDAGCEETGSVRITVLPLKDLYVPTAFTPNGDGRNDGFGPIIGFQYQFVEFTIYNRWGEKVFEAKDKNDEWDGRYKGRQLGPGAFVWRLRVKDQKGDIVEKKGSAVLVR